MIQKHTYIAEGMVIYMKNEIVLYRADELAEHIEVRFDEDTAWLTQAQIAKLFGTKRPAITKHLRNVFGSGELDEDSVSSILELTAADGKKLRNEDIQPRCNSFSWIPRKLNKCYSVSPLGNKNIKGVPTQGLCDKQSHESH